MKTLLIIQPGKYGDIIICLPIAKWYADQGYTVYWQCPDMYHDLFRNIDYCTPVIEPTEKIDKIIDLSFGFGGAPTMWWNERKTTYDSFVTAKYDLAQVPLEERWNLVWNRNESREEDLAYHLGCYDEQNRFNILLLHNQGSFGNKISEGYTDYGYRLQIHYKPVMNYNIFDWYDVIDKATTIMCVDSSLSNFIEVVPKFKHKEKILYDVRESYQFLKSIYKNNWTVK